MIEATGLYGCKQNQCEPERCSSELLAAAPLRSKPGGGCQGGRLLGPGRPPSPPPPRGPAGDPPAVTSRSRATRAAYSTDRGPSSAGSPGDTATAGTEGGTASIAKRSSPRAGPERAGPALARPLPGAGRGQTARLAFRSAPAGAVNTRRAPAQTGKGGGAHEGGRPGAGRQCPMSEAGGGVSRPHRLRLARPAPARSGLSAGRARGDVAGPRRAPPPRGAGLLADLGVDFRARRGHGASGPPWASDAHMQNRRRELPSRLLRRIRKDRKPERGKRKQTTA